MEEQIVIPICCRCDDVIRNGQQQVELLCHHLMHTTCFLAVAHLNYTCPAPDCIEPVNPNMNVDTNIDRNTVDDQTRIQNLYDTNESFKKLAHNIVKKRQLLGQKEKALVKFIRTKKEEMRERLLLLKAQLEGLTETKKSEIKDSTIYKEYLAAKRGYSSLGSKMRRDYNCSQRKMGNALHNKVGFRRFRHSSYYRHRYLFRDFYYFVRV